MNFDHLYLSNLRYCYNCGCDKDYLFIINQYTNLACSDIIDIFNSHTWVRDKYRDLFTCKICNIKGAHINGSKVNICVIDYGYLYKQIKRWGNLYSCNEYLMIKANE